jgi:hypothetical protein
MFVIKNLKTVINEKAPFSSFNECEFVGRNIILMEVHIRKYKKNMNVVYVTSKQGT